jgi:hypothetical protein
MTGVAKNAVLKLLRGMGCAAAAYHNDHVCNLRVRRVQADEIWAFLYGKDKNFRLEQAQSGLGSVWTWTALDADTKLIICYALGDRGADTAHEFMQDVASRIGNPHQANDRRPSRLRQYRRGNWRIRANQVPNENDLRLKLPLPHSLGKHARTAPKGSLPTFQIGGYGPAMLRL